MEIELIFQLLLGDLCARAAIELEGAENSDGDMNDFISLDNILEENYRINIKYETDTFAKKKRYETREMIKKKL